MGGLPAHYLLKKKNPEGMAMKKNYYHKLKLSALLLFVLSSLSAGAQWLGTFTTSNYFDDNIFGINERQSAFISSNTLFAGYAPDSASYALSYSGTLLLVDRISDLTYHSHDIAASYTYDYGQFDENSLDFLIRGRARFNTGDYTLYDNLGLSALINSNHEITPSFILNSGYKYNQKNYQENPDLSYYEHEIYTGFRKYLETNTSLHFKVNYGIKSSSSIFKSILQRGNKGSGESISQLDLSAKIGQSLSESTGLSLSYNRKINLSNTKYSGSISYIDYFMESELYDDPYSYESNEFSLTITQLLPSSVMARLSAYYADKSYSYLTDNDIDNRSDDYTGISFFIQKAFPEGWGFLKNPKVSINYSYINNSSNLEYFKYFGNSIGLTLSTGF